MLRYAYSTVRMHALDCWHFSQSEHRQDSAADSCWDVWAPSSASITAARTLVWIKLMRHQHQLWCHSTKPFRDMALLWLLCSVHRGISDGTGDPMAYSVCMPAAHARFQDRIQCLRISCIATKDCHELTASDAATLAHASVPPRARMRRLHQ